MFYQFWWISIVHGTQDRLNIHMSKLLVDRIFFFNLPAQLRIFKYLLFIEI